MTKSDREIVEILEAFDLTRCAHSAAQPAGVDEKTVAQHVAVLRNALVGVCSLVPRTPPPDPTPPRDFLNDLLARRP